MNQDERAHETAVEQFLTERALDDPRFANRPVPAGRTREAAALAAMLEDAAVLDDAAYAYRQSKESAFTDRLSNSLRIAVGIDGTTPFDGAAGR